jgi:hypothetical protein
MSLEKDSESRKEKLEIVLYQSKDVKHFFAGYQVYRLPKVNELGCIS